MGSSLTKTVAARVRNEIAEYITADEKNNLRYVIESLYDGVKSGKIRIENSEVIPVAFKERGKNSVELPEEVYQSLEETLAIDEISVEDFLKAVTDAVDEGLIWLENGKIVVENAQ